MKNNVYLGKEYSDIEIEEALKKYCPNRYKKFTDIEIITAQYISKGYIVGWFQGRSEVGPRALGNRSILADPRQDDMKNILNARVKFREFFRPFAPSVMWEYQTDYFDLNIKNPYMLIVSEVNEDKRSLIPAVTHVDNTGRVQTVIKEYNPRYHKLINEFRKITEIPVVLDTSFNVKGEPIVETPTDAIKCFLGTNIDVLVVGDYLIKKENVND